MRSKSVFKYVVPFSMVFLAFWTLLLGVNCNCGNFVQATDSSCFGSVLKTHPLASFRGGTDASAAAVPGEKIYRTLQGKLRFLLSLLFFHHQFFVSSQCLCASPQKTFEVQIIHRHGDRTPITPLKDEDYWAKTLVSQDLLDQISSNTNVITNVGESNTHAAGGRGVFGKLTQLGLFQLVNLGTKLREELVSNQHHDDPRAYATVENGKHYPYPWTPQRPLHPSNIKIVSTNFPRTIQSVQGLLVGLFPDGTEDAIIDIDARHTDNLIPDPQPRRSTEQEALETHLAKQPTLKNREDEMRPLAIRTTAALLGLLGEGALDVSFGVAEDKDESAQQSAPKLAWSQLAEITKCLQVRDRLPATITADDQEVISKYTAWRWFESLRHPRLAYLAMNPMVSRIIDAMHKHDTEPPVIIYSAHDSTLIGLMCGFRLEQPSVWPEYGSYLKMELLEVQTVGKDNEKEHVVRFSLNGSPLRSVWDEDKPPLAEIPLHLLAHKAKTEGSVATA